MASDLGVRPAGFAEGVMAGPCSGGGGDGTRVGRQVGPPPLPALFDGSTGRLYSYTRQPAGQVGRYQTLGQPLTPDI